MEVRNIPVPRLMLTPHYGELIVDDFNLNTKRLSRYATEASILEERMQGSEEKDLFGNIQQGARETELTKVSSLGEGRKQSPENTIIAALTDYPLVDYESEQKELLLKLAGQAVAHYKSFVSDERAVKMMVENNFRQIAVEIYDQILEHKKYVSDGYLESGIREPEPYLEQYNISLSLDEKPVTLESQLDRFPREKVYTGFKKACHSMYRFDSSFEGRLAYLLDKDRSVEDWLRPAPAQFDGLFWRDASGDSQNRYEPDFVVEFKNEIAMVEVKPGEEVNDPDVQEKKKTAEKYCELVSKNIGNYGIVKPWRYVIVPTEKICLSATIAGLLSGSGKQETSLYSNLRFSDVIPQGEDAEEWLPIYTLAAACGKFAGGMEIKENRWIYAGRKFDDEHFVVRAVGDSMIPAINDGDYCIFKANPGGPYSGQGRIYLFQYQGEPDPFTGGSYTIKGYQSHKGPIGLNTRVELLPKNKAYPPVVFKSEDGDIDQKLHFVAEFVKVISSN
ncbi:MAG: hypothetical protein A3D87_01925 [Omnitrophica WOR_2 bacterium RIFCSPHIGHO2_02_FULL_50_17]|nr:MAG: hypothetical protein A3D87_01925 [Omnitrophica WOR_2 bacterium RIFCSPHIGHO2_02_FULL_50_17]